MSQADVVTIEGTSTPDPTPGTGGARVGLFDLSLL